MVMGTWEMQAGDPTSFAFALGFVGNPHGHLDRSTAEEGASWGHFSIWAAGENLCAHMEQGETLAAAHWYMLPLIEWFADNWDALLHEEKPPLRNVGSSAAEALAQSKMPPLSLKKIDEFEWLDEWSAWWHRHSIRASRHGGVFPDAYLRRHRDTLEVSTGGEPLNDAPEHVFFLTPHRTCRVDPVPAASSLFVVLLSATQELRRRLPGSDRLARLETKLSGLKASARRLPRMAWATGLGEDFNRYSQIAYQVDAVMAPVPAEIRRSILSPGRSSDLVAYGNPHARLLYGAVSPSITVADSAEITRLLINNHVPDTRQWLAALESDELRALANEIRQLSLEEQGSRLGERACELLVTTTGPWVDVHEVVGRLDIELSRISLSDPEVRALSVFGPTQKPHVACNRNAYWGQDTAMERLTLAHELCHLFLDREWGDELAVASGPWTPASIEQRANTFAGAFLMPSWLLRDAITELDRPMDDLAAMTALASRLRVSVPALVDRLYNLGELTVEDRFRLRAPGVKGP